MDEQIETLLGQFRLLLLQRLDAQVSLGVTGA
jgi:hypothetical protein